MTFGVVIVSNGRGALLEEMLRGLARHVLPVADQTLVCDDSGDSAYARRLQDLLPSARIDAHRHLGHGPAVARAWQGACRLDVDWVLWMEEDMVFGQDIDLREVADVVTRGDVVQMVFRRNSHFPAEVAAGPTQVSRFDPELFTDEETNGHPWLRHRLFYSLNPHVVSRAFLRRHRWPAVPNSEHHFSRHLFRLPAMSVGLWGAREDPPLVIHAGTTRTGTGY